MNLGGVIHLGWRYLSRSRAKTALLVAAFSLVWSLPGGVGLIVGRPVNATILTEAEWNEATPFLEEVRRGGMLAVTGTLGDSEVV